jgi:hypothetical protein
MANAAELIAMFTGVAGMTQSPEIIVRELILNDQTKRRLEAAGVRYATREETEKRVEELLYVIGTAGRGPAAPGLTARVTFRKP